MEHSSHSHPLVLNEIYIAREDDVCRGCGEQVVSSKSFIYSCSFVASNANSSTGTSAECATFLLHKSCAELPRSMIKLTKSNKILLLGLVYSSFNLQRYPHRRCNICTIPMAYKVKQFYYCYTNYVVCVKCAMFLVQQSSEDPKFDHPAHPEHPVALVQHPSSFKCYACNIDDNIRDISYRCTKCQFWVHKTCADAPTSFQYQFHYNHPLILEFSLPLVFQKFKQYCKLCNLMLGRYEWLYCCHNCRYFVHFQCARSSQMLSFDENEFDDSNLVHLPAANVLSVNLLLEQFVKGMSTLNNNNNINFNVPSHIKHWAHDEHHLQLITINELRDHKDGDENLLLCDGCVKPIRTGDDSFYGCVPCKLFLHKFCAELPTEIQHHLWPGKSFFAGKSTKRFFCDGCRFFCTGIFFADSRMPSNINIRLHLGCMTLPKTIKHEAHRHPLKQVYTRHHDCKACGRKIRPSIGRQGIMYGCEHCDYYICTRCSISKPRTLEHRWDPHSLQLIYKPGMVEDHEHEFNCEFCSEEINPSFWFYHCSHCDLSLHLAPCFMLALKRQLRRK